jgi:hypothetical protein
MQKKSLRYRKVAHGDYRVYHDDYTYRYSNSRAAKQLYRAILKKEVRKELLKNDTRPSAG